MTFEDFDKLFDALIADARGMRDTKGPEYAGLKDRLANFKDQAPEFGVSPMVVCGIFMDKHQRAIKSYIRGEYKGSEPIRGRIVDNIVYLALLYGLIDESDPKHSPNCSACGGSGYYVSNTQSSLGPLGQAQAATTEHTPCPACKGTGKQRPK